MPITCAGEWVNACGHDARISEGDIVVVFFGVKDIAVELCGFVSSISFACIVAAIFVWKLVPETKGKTLEDMTALWKNRK